MDCPIGTISLETKIIIIIINEVTITSLFFGHNFSNFITSTIPGSILYFTVVDIFCNSVIMHHFAILKIYH